MILVSDEKWTQKLPSWYTRNDFENLDLRRESEW